MKTALFCPTDRVALSSLSARKPLVLIPLLGRSILDRQLTALAADKVAEVEIHAADRPEQIRQATGHGEAWGLRTEVISTGGNDEEATIVDRPPGAAASALASPRAWFEAARKLFADPAPPIGMREHSPGIWIHVRASVAADAQLVAPCWIGARARIGPQACLGPGAIIEDDCYVDQSAAIEESWVGPATYVGAFTELIDSLAWGSWLCKWTSGSEIEIADAFLLADLPAQKDRRGTPWLSRATAFITGAATSPVILVAGLISGIRRRPFLIKKTAVLPDQNLATYFEFGAWDGLLRRWPRLFSIVSGDFRWVGNPPLTADQAAQLDGEFEQMWTAVSPGLFGQGDCHGCTVEITDESKAHASFYTACRTWRGDLKLILSVLWRVFRLRKSDRNSAKSAHENTNERNHSPSHRIE